MAPSAPPLDPLLVITSSEIPIDHPEYPPPNELLMEDLGISKTRNFDMWSTYFWRSLAIMILMLRSVYIERLQRL